MRAAVEATPELGVREACEALGISRATLYRARVDEPEAEPAQMPALP